MIYIFGEKNTLLQKLPASLKGQQMESVYINGDHLTLLRNIYENSDKTPSAIITENKLEGVPQDMLLDLLEGWSRRIPVLIISDTYDEAVAHAVQSNSITWIQKPTVDDVSNFLRAYRFQSFSKDNLPKTHIPVYNPQIAARLLRNNGFLCIVSIHAIDFTKVSLEYGSAVYHQLQMALNKILYDMWGSHEAFRKTDLLCRRSSSSNTFYVLLERPRSENSMPLPGDLEKLAERLSIRLENLMWKELTSASQERILPKFLDLVPRFVVSYASALYNPCVDIFTITEGIIRSCRDTAKIQDIRMLNRQRELIQTLIQTPELLRANYQAVFDLRKFKNGTLQKLNKKSAELQDISHTLYAFESLARVNKASLQKMVGEDLSLNVDFLSPSVLFAQAEAVNLKLELDQACFKLGIQSFKNLPGKLMVNILPRNFYFIHDLTTVIPSGVEVIFEVSETEAINNMSLIQSIRDSISKHSHGIAIDDFGKGYAGVDRVIKIQPNIIKLDQILINQIDQDPRMQTFVKGLVDAARSTKSLVLAEGIETREELLTLIDIGIDLGQGFYLHRPESREEILGRLKKK